MEENQQDQSKPCAQRLRDVRNHLKLNQKEFAAKLGISSSYLSEIETGKTKPGYNFLTTLAEMFDISSDYLLHGVGGMFLNQDSPDMVRLEFGEHNEEVKEMLDYFKVSPLVKLTVMAYLSKFLLTHEDIIEKDIKKSNGNAKK